MPHRAHLFSIRIAHALRERCFLESYRYSDFSKDILAGITVGIIAMPLAMALAIASGVAPQQGLYTAIIAGFIIALCGGSRLSISGPTAAFVVILQPIAQQYGLSGLLIASLMAGGMLLLMALFRLGRFIEFIPEPVTLGFTSGIAVVIALLQVKDAFGLSIEHMPEGFINKCVLLLQQLPHSQMSSVSIAALTLLVLLLWPRLRSPIPAHLPALLLAAGAGWLLVHNGIAVDTIGSRFHYSLADGSSGAGIPPILPQFVWPWLQPGPQGVAPDWTWSSVQALVPAAFAIAMLGAIESLLCAVVLDGMTGKRHSANSELLGQGIGNLITPFFGGITATAAIARSAANFRAGAQSPIAGMVHAIVVLLGLVVFAPWLAYIPMAAMASLLLMVAWHMSEAPKALRLIKKSPRGDIWVLLTCFSLTIVFDMVIAISAGILLASLLFVKELASLTRVIEITGDRNKCPAALPEHWGVYQIQGPLFFAAADRIFGELALLTISKQGIVLCLEGVSLLDAGGLASLEKLIRNCELNQTQLSITGLQFQPLRTLAKARVQPIHGILSFHSTLADACSALESVIEAPTS